MKKLTARFYLSATGQNPVRDWILSLAVADKRVVGRDIQKVEFGWPIGMPYCRSLGGGLWEVRSDLADGRIGRIIFCIIDNEMVLLHAFIKKTRKNPVARFGFGLTPEARSEMTKENLSHISDETFDAFLEDQGLLAETEEAALKAVIADQIRQAMLDQGITKTAMALRMQTDRRQLDRLLDPLNSSVTLSTLRRAAAAVGRTLRVELI